VSEIRVLLASVNPFLSDVLRTFLSTQPGIRLSPERSQHDALLVPASADLADVVIVGMDHGMIPAVCAPLLYAQPQLKVFAISADGRNTILYRLNPDAVTLGNVSPDELVVHIRESLGRR
jgi:DNA-binding NarL/FixJ family response regulator